VTEPLPYRIRLAVTGGPVAGHREALLAEVQRQLPVRIVELFDPASRMLVADATHTPIAYVAVLASESAGARLIADAVGSLPLGRVEDARSESAREVTARCDVVVALGSGPDDALLREAAARERPAVVIDGADPPSFATTARGGLNAQSIVRLEEFNAHEIGADDLAREIEDACRREFGGEQKAGIPAAVKAPVLTGLLPFYVKGSRLAATSQSSYYKAGRTVWRLFPLAIAAVALAVIREELALWAFLLEFGLLLFILIVVVRADRARSLERWLENRFLTERLRSAVFLTAGGVEPATIAMPPHLGTPHRHGWPVMAFSEIWARMPGPRLPTPDQFEGVKSFIHDVWIGGQLEYHRNAAGAKRRRGRFFERAGWAMIGLAVLAAGTHVVTLLLHHGDAPSTSERILTFLSIVLPGLGAAAGGFRTHREYSRIAKRSANMAVALRDLAERIEGASSPGELAPLLRDAERVMLLEVQDWLGLMQFAAVEPPG
jgi:hypothetical protein